MEQAVTTLANGTSLMLNSGEPVIIKDVVLLSEGVWTGEDSRPTNFLSSEIENGHRNSDWKNMNLYLDHKDTKSSAVAYWAGFVRNPRMDGKNLMGDLEIWHPMLSMFIKQAKAKFAVSATINGVENLASGSDYSEYKINSFKSFSLVDEPGCENSWLPKSFSNNKNCKVVTAGFVDNTSQKEMNEDKISEESSEKKLHSCKEVEMTEEKPKESIEDKKEDKKEEAKEETSETKESSSEENKELHAKIDKITKSLASLAETVKTLAAEKEESKEEAKEEPAEKSEEKTEEKPEESPKEESKTEKELSSVKKKLEETQKELDNLKKEGDSPDRKTLASAGEAVDSTNDTNAGMLSFFRERSNIPIY